MIILLLSSLLKTKNIFNFNFLMPYLQKRYDITLFNKFYKYKATMLIWAVAYTLGLPLRYQQSLCRNGQEKIVSNRLGNKNLMH